MQGLRVTRGLLAAALAGGLLTTACGSDGAAGKDGVNGKDGTNGADGTNGSDGSNGGNGKDGTNGTDGTNGKDGMDGKDGTSPDAGTAPMADALQFTGEAQVPTTDAAKRFVRAASGANIDGKWYPLGYHTVMRSGDKPGGETIGFGTLVDKNLQPIKAKDGSIEVAASNDFSSILKVGAKLFSVTHFESQPGAMYLSELTQGKDGLLKAVSTKPVDFKDVDGLWNPCAGSVTPWNTHLGSEEYPADARAFLAATSGTGSDAVDLNKTGVATMLRYYGVEIYNGDGTLKVDVTKQAVIDAISPYYHGHPVEISVAENGDVTVAKHYAMGRMAVELAKVMPDNKTVYISDDGTNVGFYMFVADTAGDLSAGKLYAMRWVQTSPDGKGMGEANIQWIALGHASDAEVKALLHPVSGSAPTFADIFASETPNADGTCPSAPDFHSLNTEAGSECLKLKDGMELAASRLETRRYAGYMHATTELRKEEGITLDPDSKTLFVAMSEIERGMENNQSAGKASTKYDVGGPNHIRVAYNPCGGVYKYELGHDNIIGSDWVALSVKGLVAGWTTTYDQSSEYFAIDTSAAFSAPTQTNTCDINGLGNPDNLTFMTGFDTLIIGEDATTAHQNDFVWAYNMSSGKMTRLLTTPYGAETTSVYWYPNINGFGYLRAIVQHPYGESDLDKTNGDATVTRSYDGYLGPFPKMD